MGQCVKKDKRLQIGRGSNWGFWAYRDYLPRVINKMFPKLLDAEIAIENRLFKKVGSLAFYKLRKL